MVGESQTVARSAMRPSFRIIKGGKAVTGPQMPSIAPLVIRTKPSTEKSASLISSLKTSGLVWPESLTNIDPKAAFFEPLRQQYQDFEMWFGKAIKENRPTFVLRDLDQLKAIMILKDETDYVVVTPRFLSKARRLKICTLRVDVANKNLAIRRLLYKAINHAKEQGISEIYIRLHKEKDAEIIGQFSISGFKHVGDMIKTGESVYILKVSEDENKVA